MNPATTAMIALGLSAAALLTVYLLFRHATRRLHYRDAAFLSPGRWLLIGGAGLVLEGLGLVSSSASLLTFGYVVGAALLLSALVSGLLAATQPQTVSLRARTRRSRR